MKPKPFGLALGAGAIRGLCHVGVLEVLEQNGLVPDMISGTSMGAVVGGLYAAGVPISKMKELVGTLKKSDVVDFNLFALKNNGFLTGKKSEMLIKELCGDIRIEDCKIPFVAVAVDVISGKTVYIREGKLTDAIRASYAVPGVFAAKKKDNMLLVDGGIKERIPVNILREMGAKYVLGVNPCDGIIEDKCPTNIALQLGRIFEIMDWELTRRKLNEADYVLSIKSKLMNSSSISEASVAYEQGREAALLKLDDIRRAIHRKLRKGLFFNLKKQKS